jgi:peptidyl-prolyl cis-trans isomerase C
MSAAALETPAPAAGCSIKPAIERGPRKVAVNGVVIPRETIARETQNHPAATPVAAWKAAAKALVLRELVLQEATRRGDVPDPREDAQGRRETPEEALIRGLIEEAGDVPAPDEATCRAHFEANAARYRSPDLYETRHILLAVTQGDKAALDAALAQAREFIGVLLAEPKTFRAMAETFSACPSGKNGGSLGQIGPGQTVPEFEAVLAGMEDGTVHPEPVVSRYGIHVIVLDKRIEGRELPFDYVRPRILARLHEQARRHALRCLIASLLAGADIEGVTFDDAGQEAVS